MLGFRLNINFREEWIEFKIIWLVSFRLFAAFDEVFVHLLMCMMRMGSSTTKR